jgi:DNA polymerase III delta prime subunit
MNLLWFEKHRPKKISELLIVKKDLDAVQKWIKNFNNKVKGTPNCLFLHGPPGIGKTSLANIILTENGYDVCEFNASEVRNQKQIKEQINEINGNVNVLDFMNFKKKKMGIIMDEIDGMSSNDRGGLGELIDIIFEKTPLKKDNNIPSGSPFVCISNTIDKKIKTLMNKSVCIKLSLPSKLMMINLCRKILKIELQNKYTDIDEKVLINIINYSQNDIRRLVNLLEFLFFDKEADIKIICENIDEKLNQFSKKNLVIDPYKSCDLLLNQYQETSKAIDIWDNDRVIINSLLIENVASYVFKNRKNELAEKVETLREIYEWTSVGDILDKFLLVSQEYSISNYIGYIRCVFTNYKISKLTKFYANKYNNLNYSTIINKGSFEYLSFKQDLQYNHLILNFPRVVAINKLADLFVLLMCNRFDIFLEICKKYKLNGDDITKRILKISQFGEIVSIVLKKKLKKIKN